MPRLETSRKEGKEKKEEVASEGPTSWSGWKLCTRHLDHAALLTLLERTYMTLGKQQHHFIRP